MTASGAQLAFTQKLKGLPLTVTKTYAVTADALTVEWKYEATENLPAKASFWTKSLTVGEPKLEHPDFPTDIQVLALGEGIPDGFNERGLARAASPVSTTVWNGVTMTATPADGSAPMNYYAWQSSTIKTWEWMSPMITIEPGKPVVRRMTFKVK